MSDPIQFDSTTPRFGLPFLFAGQAQKEFFVNEAHALLDALLHPAVEGEADDPPDDPVGGEAWLVGTNPTGAWEDHPSAFATWQAGNWLFASPAVGMTVFDKTARQRKHFDGKWNAAEPVVQPDGGATVDAEARTAIAGLISALIAGGILAPA